MPGSLETAEGLQIGCLLEILSKVEFLNLGPIDILGRRILCLRGYLALWEVETIPGLYSLDASNPSFPAVTTKRVPRHCQTSLQ